MKVRLFLIAGFLTILLLAGGCKTKNTNSKNTAKPDISKVNSSLPAERISIHQAALDGQLSQVIKLLPEGLDVDLKDTEGRTPLMYAAFNGHKEIIKILIEKGANVNLRDRSGRTALMMASSGPFKESVKLLLDNYADPNITDNEEHFSALMYAASEGQLEIVKLLLASKADPSLKDIDGDDALSFAKNNGHGEVALILQSVKK